MERTSMQKIIEITGGRLLAGDPSVTVTGMDIDSRTVKPGDLFVAIVGERVDAHRFVPQVIESGVRGVIVTEEDACPEGTDACVVLVPDAVKAMQQIGKWYLDAIDVRRVGVTGSVGKTTTRDMIYHILKEKYRTGSASKNHNSLIGMPLAITQFDSSMEVVVLEEGMGGAGDIHLLSDLARPEVAVITNVGISHLEILGSRENIRKAKLEIVDFFRESDTLVINADNDMLDADRIRAEKGNFRIVTGGAEGPWDYQVRDVEDFGEEGIRFTICHGSEQEEIRLRIPGRHNALNAALAIGAGAAMGVTLEEAKQGLEKMTLLTGKRMLFRKGNGMTVLDDSYNAAPASMKAAVDTLMATKASRHIAILGRMGELGPDAPRFHAEVGEYAAEAGVDLLIAVSEEAKPIYEGASGTGKGEALWFATNEDVIARLPELLREGDVILTKASNTARLGQVADAIVGTENQ
ncbi:MAG: UDP-N-acetylmuramoyl-tripeptide--D-alanyl-D-alanine ligase [Eubacteriales bacterium]|nr:UDP-N-acetylmuramoyl-tripeptide--D-alanyl-D-alanine ligase [Eubacteriales bacterium]